MNTLSIDFSSQLLEVFSASTSLRPETQPTSNLPQPSATAGLTEPAIPTNGSSAATTTPPSGEAAPFTQTTTTAAFLDLHIQIQLAEQERNRRPEHELRHRTRHALREIGHDVSEGLRTIVDQNPSLSKEDRHAVKELGEDFKKALKQAFRGMFGHHHRAERAPLLMSPNDLLSSVQGAFDELTSRLNALLGLDSSQSPVQTPTDQPASSTQETQTTADAAALTAATASEPAGGTAVEPQASSEPPAEETGEKTEAAENPLQALANIFDKLLTRLSDLFSQAQPLPTARPGPAFSATVDLTFAFSYQTSLQFSTGPTGETVNATA